MTKAVFVALGIWLGGAVAVGLFAWACIAWGPFAVLILPVLLVLAMLAAAFWLSVEAIHRHYHPELWRRKAYDADWYRIDK